MRTQRWRLFRLPDASLTRSNSMLDVENMHDCTDVSTRGVRGSKTNLQKIELELLQTGFAYMSTQRQHLVGL